MLVVDPKNLCRRSWAIVWALQHLLNCSRTLFRTFCIRGNNVVNLYMFQNSKKKKLIFFYSKKKSKNFFQLSSSIECSRATSFCQKYMCGSANVNSDHTCHTLCQKKGIHDAHLLPFVQTKNIATFPSLHKRFQPQLLSTLKQIA